MAKFLDASGVKHFWGKITDWVNGLGISHSDIDKLTYSSPTLDKAFDFPRISLERCSNDKASGELKIKNGYKYAQAGYVPILFCKMRHWNRGVIGGKTEYQSEFMRHPRVFLTIGEADSLGMFWRLSQEDINNFSDDKFLKCSGFFSEFQLTHLYSNTDFANILCKTEYNITTYLPVYVHTYKYRPLHRRDTGLGDPASIRSWKGENGVFDGEYNVPSWALRKLEFEFKIGFCPNYFSYRNPNTKEFIKYDPANQLQSDYFYYYSDYTNAGGKLFYDQYMDTTKEFPIEINHRYKLSDCVSNIVTFKCVINAGGGGPFNYSESVRTDSINRFRLIIY